METKLIKCCQQVQVQVLKPGLNLPYLSTSPDSATRSYPRSPHADVLTCSALPDEQQALSCP